MSGFFDLIGTIAAGVVGAWVAAQVALGQWRAQMVAQRKADLAEQLLADFYRMRSDTIFNPLFTIAHLLGDESAQQYGRMRIFEVFDAIRSKRPRFEAVFGEEAKRAFELADEIQSAVYDKLAPLPPGAPPPSKPSPDVSKPDIWALRDEAIAIIEPICRAAFNAERGLAAGGGSGASEVDIVRVPPVAADRVDHRPAIRALRDRSADRRLAASRLRAGRHGAEDLPPCHG